MSERALGELGHVAALATESWSGSGADPEIVAAVELDKTRAFLDERLPRTRSALDDGAAGADEGIVLRTADRGTIAKARFQDYDRTLRRKR